MDFYIFWWNFTYMYVIGINLENLIIVWLVVTDEKKKKC